MTNRTDISPGVWAEDAETAIPSTPLPGVSYRDPVGGAANIRDGWPYDRPVDSKDYNQIMNMVTRLLTIYDKRGVLPYSELVDYDEIPAYVVGDNGRQYKSKVINGPSTINGVQDPVLDIDSVYWQEFGGSVVAAGLFTTFPPKRLANTGSVNGSPEGFVRDGDRFVMPATSQTAMEYYNAANALVFTKTTPAAINALATDWVSFRLSDDRALLWVVVMSTATNTFYTATINPAGVVVAIGSAVAATVLTRSNHAWAGNSPASPVNVGGGANLLLIGGSLVMRFDLLEITINPATGAIVSEVVGASLKGAMKSTLGIYFYPWQRAVTEPDIKITASRVALGGMSTSRVFNVYAPLSIGLSLSDPASIPQPNTFLEWGGEIIMTNAAARGSVVFDPGELMDNIDQTLKNFRLDK